MGFIARNKYFALAVVAIVVFYFFTRMYNLTGLPIFTDEAIYLRWAQIAGHDANWRFISLTDGKQPSYIWLTIAAMRFIQDPLLAGRMVSVIAGFASVVGLFFVGTTLFKNKWIGIVASALYALYPMAMVYDRMALYDSLVGAFTVWGFYFMILLTTYVRFDLALVLGMVVGAGMLTKTNAFFTLPMAPFTLVLFDWKKKQRIPRLLRWVLYVVVAAIVSNVMYSVLRLSPFFHIITEKNQVFVYPLREWIMHPFTFFYGNIRGEFDWLQHYMTWPIVLLVVGSFVVHRKNLLEKLLLVIWFAAPFVYLAFFGKTLYPRFIFFMTLFLLPLAAYALYYLRLYIKNIVLYILVCLVVAVYPLYMNYFIITDFVKAPIPYSDMTQFSLDWPAGGGVNDAVAYLKDQAKDKKIYIGTGGTFGLMPFALELYLVDNPNVTIKGFWPIENDLPPIELVAAAKKQDTYMLFYQPLCPSCKTNIGGEAPPWKIPMTEVLRIKKGEINGNPRFLTIYKIGNEK